MNRNNNKLDVANEHYNSGNYEKAIKYYLLTIEEGDSDAMLKLGDYYNNIEKQFICT